MEENNLSAISTYLKNKSYKPKSFGTKQEEETIPEFGDVQIQQDQGTITGWIQDLVANMGAKKLFANKTGYDFGELSEEFSKEWSNIIDFNRLYSTLFTAYKKGSVDGKTYISMFETNEEVLYSIAQYGKHLSYNNRLVYTETYQQLTKGSIDYLVVEKATDKDITREFYSNENGKFETINSDNLRSELGIDIKSKIVHNYGFVPVVLIENMPSEDGNGESDLYNQEPLLNKVEALWTEMGVDIDIEKSYLAVNMAQGSLQTQSNKDESLKKIVGNFKKHNAIFQNQDADSWIGDDNKFKPFEIMRGQSRLNELLKAYNNILSMILQSKGFSFTSQDSNEAKNNKTEFEVNIVKDSEVGAFKFKQIIWENAIKELMFKTFVMKGMDVKKEELGVKINILDIKNETALIDNTLKLFNANVINKNQALSDVKNMTIEETVNYYEEMEEVQTEDLENESQDLTGREAGDTLGVNLGQTNNDIPQEEGEE